VTIDRHGTAFTFWLSYLESHGGLWEQSGDTVLAVLPHRLTALHSLPETAQITDDPDIARDDGVLYLGAGNPEIDKGAEAVVESGDVGVATVAHSGKALSTDDLLAKIRDQVPVEHGRIDATGSVTRSHRPMLRLAALISHTVSADEQFTEAAECLLDVASRVAWPPDSAARLRDAAATAGATPRPAVPAGLLAPAVAAAHHELDAAATRRGRDLATDADAERAAELTRASEYYAAALASIHKRRTSADAQRSALLDARARATVAERDRRLAEITEKYRHQHQVRPYRLHLVDLPVWRLPTDVRRGERRWPLVFDYLPLLGSVAPTRCPTCDAHSPLVATKTRLGCQTCVQSTPVSVPTASPAPDKPHQATPPPTPSIGDPTATRRPARDGTAATRRVQPPQRTGTDSAAADRHGPGDPPGARRIAPPPPFIPGKPEDRKILDFWKLVAAADSRKLHRLIAPDSPLAALIRLFGPAGPLFGIGVPPGAVPVRFTSGHYAKPVAGGRGGTGGAVSTQHDEHQYLLLWSPDKLLDEILPYSVPWHPGRHETACRRVTVPAVTAADTGDDLVAQLLLTRTTARHGLPFAARTLAAWWRLSDPDALLTRFSPRVLAATIDRSVLYWSGLSQISYPASAAAFRADEAHMRTATPMLQKQLQLSSRRNW
jgi:hypothetical protein